MKFPLAAQVLFGAAIGSLLGLAFGRNPYLFGLGNAELGTLGVVVIRLLKTLAAPLILTATIDAFVRTRITAQQGFRLVSICLVNVSMACLLSLVLMNGFHPGYVWRGKIAGLVNQLPGAATVRPLPKGATLDPVSSLASYVPDSVLEPLLSNNIVSLVLSAIFLGAALRSLRRQFPEHAGLEMLGQMVNATFLILIQILGWVVRAVPIAVLGTTADAVGKSGLSVFLLLAPFTGIIILGLGIHALIYYPLVAWLVGRISPRKYLLGCADAAFTGLSCNSSLASVPVTLICLTRKLGVSETSARLAACVGTNLNNDGVALYEAVAALFLAQALGPPDLTMGQQVGILLASVMAGTGAAGVPEAGLVVLPLVLAAAGFPENLVATAIPLFLPVDWIIARCRSGVNVMSDVVVGVMLDGLGRPEDDALSLLPLPPGASQEAEELEL